MTEVTGRGPAPTVSDWAPSVRAPAFWQALHYLSNPVGFFCEAHARYGDAFTIRVLGERWVVLAHAKLVKEAFAQGPFEVNSGEPNQVLRPVIGTRNLLLMDGAEHLHRRRMVLPAFHGERIAGYEHMIRDAIRTEISRWPLRAPVAVLPRMDALVLRIVLRCVLGAEQTDRFTRLASRLQQILAWITDRRRLLVYFLLGPEQLMRLPAFARQVRALDREVFALIAQRRVADDLKRREDILSLLIQAQDEEGTGLSDGELRDELVTLLVAGHQNTAALLSWAIHALDRDPESQEALATQPERVASAIITETLRLRPPVPLMVRRARRELLID